MLLSFEVVTSNGMIEKSLEFYFVISAKRSFRG